VTLMINKWESVILNRLISIYEQRFHSGSSFKQKITLKFNSDDFIEYTNPSQIDDLQLIENAVIKLEKEKFIDVVREKYTKVVLRINLVMESVDLIYEYIGSDEIKVKYENFFNEFQNFNCLILNEYKNYLLDRLSVHKPIKNHIMDIQTTRDVFLSIQTIENLKNDIIVRNLSVQLFSDSKKLEKLLAKIESIYKTVMSDFSGEYFISKGLLKNPSYIYLKGDREITINNQVINLKELGASIGINSELVDKISVGKVDKITTIENLTSFNKYNSSGLVVYLGGFSNHVMKSFLKKAVDSQAKLYHFGDIDYGGFLILLDIYNNIGVLPKTINMDIPSLEKKLGYCKDISNDPEYKRKLTTLLDKEVLSDHFVTIEYMLENNIILEQEAFDI